MSIFIRPNRWLRVRVSRRGTRVGVGPRWLRFWTGGGGGDGVSTGGGPFTLYRPIRRRRW